MRMSKKVRVVLILGGGIIAPALLLALCIGSAAGLHDPASGFKHKSPQYYAAFAKSCDSLLVQYLTGTNRFVEVPVTDTSLPKIIRDVHPFKIKVERNHVWILAGGTSHVLGYGISWEPNDEAKTNVWALSTTQESQTRVLYVAER
jgi:hypothetical protein